MNTEKIAEYLRELAKFRENELSSMSEFNSFNEKDYEAYVARTDEIIDEADKLDAEKNDYKDLYIRMAADFDNYKKRIAREREMIVKNASKDMVMHVLGIVDDFERLQSSIANTNDPIADGIELIYTKFMSMLEEVGCKKIECNVNDAFDYAMHEAVSSMKSLDVDDGHVLVIVQTGWILNNIVIRPTKVVVAKNED